MGGIYNYTHLGYLPQPFKSTTRELAREESDMDRMTMKIDGMTCGHCVGQVTKALEGLEGVEVEQVTVGTATVSYDPNTASEGRIARAVEDRGYAVSGTAK